jgi:acetyltransferase-like isoleucine patch superfamily enzyme
MGGGIRVEEECWIGFGAAIIGGQGELVIGKHSVIRANASRTRYMSPYLVVSVNPARVVRQCDVAKKTTSDRLPWVYGHGLRKFECAA